MNALRTSVLRTSVLRTSVLRTSVLRTPDSRFENLPGYDFVAKYADIDGLRMRDCASLRQI